MRKTKAKKAAKKKKQTKLTQRQLLVIDLKSKELKAKSELNAAIMNVYRSVGELNDRVNQYVAVATKLISLLEDMGGT